jgi:hypothetical protein
MTTRKRYRVLVRRVPRWVLKDDKRGYVTGDRWTQDVGRTQLWTTRRRAEALSTNTEHAVRVYVTIEEVRG